MSDELEKITVNLHFGLQYETIREADVYAKSMIDYLHNGGEGVIDTLCEGNMPASQDIAVEEARAYFRATEIEERELRLDLLYLTLCVRQAHEVISRKVPGDYTQAIGGAIGLKQRIKQILVEKGYST